MIFTFIFLCFSLCKSDIKADRINNARLTSLDLSYNNKITDEGIKGLTNLTLYNNKITDEGIKGLIYFLII